LSWIAEDDQAKREYQEESDSGYLPLLEIRNEHHIKEDVYPIDLTGKTYVARVR
jgi:hypothetical protein